MTDKKIIDLLNARDESALSELQKAYAPYCLTVAKNLLGNRQDAEECVNDAWLAIWNAIPPEKPKSLSAYVAKIVRNIALQKYRASLAQKRNGDVYSLSEELLGSLSHDSDISREYDSRRIGLVIDIMLRKMSKLDRRVFVLRYFDCNTIAEISKALGLTRRQVEVSIERTKKKLAEELKKEGISI